MHKLIKKNKKMFKPENYHNDITHVSKSGLDKIELSPAHYYHYYLNPSKYKEQRKITPAMILGNLFHTILMEPNLFTSRYLVLPRKIDKRTTEGRELYFKYLKAGKGKEIIKAEDYNTALYMRESVLRHPIAASLFAAGKAETIYTFNDPTTGVNCKIRLDWETPDNIIVDLKSAMDASCILLDDTAENPETQMLYKGFPKAIFNRRYDVQDVFYSDGYQTATGIKPRAFVFVAVEKEPPYEVSLYYLGETIRDKAREKYINNLQQYKNCLRNNQWPGYPDKIIKISAPEFE